MEPITNTFNTWNYAEFSRARGHMLVDVHVFSSDGMTTKFNVGG